jgi:hypothetical protein
LLNEFALTELGMARLLGILPRPPERILNQTLSQSTFLTPFIGICMTRRAMDNSPVANKQLFHTSIPVFRENSSIVLHKKKKKKKGQD